MDGKGVIKIPSVAARFAGMTTDATTDAGEWIFRDEDLERLIKPIVFGFP
jgi:hypothetical protein